jgi:hypothetical protein
VFCVVVFGGKYLQCLQDELIGEFTGKNTGWRVLSDKKIETSSQGTGKFLGVEAFMVATVVSGKLTASSPLETMRQRS